MKLSRIIFLSLALIMILSVSLGMYYYFQMKKNVTFKEKIHIISIIDYGILKNGSYDEYHLYLNSSSTAYDAFSLVAELSVVKYPYGVYIKAVNGYEENLPFFWAFYYYNHTEYNWVYSEKGVSNYILKNNDKIMLFYTNSP